MRPTDRSPTVRKVSPFFFPHIFEKFISRNNANVKLSSDHRSIIRPVKETEFREKLYLRHNNVFMFDATRFSIRF